MGVTTRAAGPRRETDYVSAITRRAEDKTSETGIAQVAPERCAAGGRDTKRRKDRSFLIRSVEWENTYCSGRQWCAWWEVQERLSVEVGEAMTRQEAKVFAHDIFSAAAPTGLQAVFSGGKVHS